VPIPVVSPNESKALAGPLLSMDLFSIVDSRLPKPGINTPTPPVTEEMSEYS
jgi:hypothetical protein